MIENHFDLGFGVQLSSGLYCSFILSFIKIAVGLRNTFERVAWCEIEIEDLKKNAFTMEDKKECCIVEHKMIKMSSF